METRNIFLCVIFFTISVHLANGVDKCTDPMGEDGYCIYSEDCPRIMAIFNNPQRRRNDTIFVSDSFCGRTFVNNVSKLKVCCDATSVSIEPGCVVPSSPTNGEFRISGSIPKPGTIVPHRTILRYNCYENFRPDPQRSVYCQKNDEWSNKISCTMENNHQKVPVNQDCQYPEKAIRTNRTKQIAWNKCIDIADTVFPCDISSKRRIEQCQVLPKTELYQPKPVKPYEFPFVGTLVFHNTSDFNSCFNEENDCSDLYKVCGGTLISDQWVITTAHCIFQKYAGEEVKYVKFSDDAFDFKSASKNTYKVIEIIKHPEYKQIQVYNDIALIKLESPVTISSKIRPACLHVGNEIGNSKLTSIWWERSSNDSKLYKELLSVYSNDECNKIYEKTRKIPNGIRDDIQICAGSGRQSDECPVSSGFPLLIYNENVFCTYTVVATGAFGRPCSSGSPDVYVKIAPYIRWIESIVWP